MFRIEFINYFKENKKSLFDHLSSKQGNLQLIRWINSKQEKSHEISSGEENIMILFDEFNFMQLC